MTMLKELTEEEINGLSNTQLYNLTFAPLIPDIKNIEEFTQKQMSQSAVCVYGATIVPIKRRMEKLYQVTSKNSPGLIVFSGGFGWDGNNLKGISIEEQSKTWKTDTYMARVNKRTNDVIKHYPEIEDEVLEKMRNYWKKENNGSDKDFEESMDSLINDIVEEYMQKMMENPETESEFMNMYHNQTKNIPLISFSQWLKNYIKKNFVRQFILNKCSEADFMQIIWDKVYNKQGNIESKTVMDNSSVVTCENGENCLKILDEYPQIKNLIIINEWPYLLRAVLTTKKVAERLGSKVNIMGLPANVREGLGFKYKDIEDYRNGLITQIRKMVTYPDVGDMDITQYLKMKEICEGGPRIEIGDRLLESAEKDIKELE